MFILSCGGEDKSIGKIASKDSMLIQQYLGQSSNVWKDEGYTVLTKSTNGRKTMKIITDTLVNNSESGNITFDPLDLYMYDSVGVQTLNVKSVHGFFYQAKHLTIATRNVELESKTEDKLIMLYTDSLVFLQDSNEVEVFPVHMKIFTPGMDTVLYVVHAKRGRWNLKTLKSTLHDDVKLEYLRDNVELLCEDLLFDSKEDVVRSEGHVKFKRVSGDYIEGDGFLSDSRFEHWKIKENIKGEILDLEVGSDGL